MLYSAFLRGINVGGNRKLPMADLRNMMTTMGFENVTTLLNSGNVVFEASETDEVELTRLIEGRIEKTFGFASRVMLRSMTDIRALLELDPFKGIHVDKDTRLYVTFLPEPMEVDIELPYVSDTGDFQILVSTEREVSWVLQLETARTVDAMVFLEKVYGKDVTTRNWNTVVKIGSKMGIGI